MKKMEDQRIRLRFPVDSEIIIRTSNDAAYGYVRDLSSSGLFAYSEGHFPIDTLCEIEFAIKTGGQEMRIKEQTQVVRLEKDEETGYQGVGLRIIENDILEAYGDNSDE